MNPFEQLLKELGTKMGVPLHADTHQACQIDFSQGLKVQIDLQGNADSILIGSQIGTLPPGSFRDKIFLKALRVNGMQDDPKGILAFSEKNEMLVLFQSLPIASLNGEKLHFFLERFVEHASLWQEALKQGTIPEVQEGASSSSSGMFGLRQ